jgi:hypothetical protein
MPVIVDIKKNKQIKCYREAFKLMLNSNYDKIIDLFADDPSEIRQFINMFKSEGDKWVLSLSPELNKIWRARSDYYVYILAKYLEILVNIGNPQAIEFSSKVSFTDLII